MIDPGPEKDIGERKGLMGKFRSFFKAEYFQSSIARWLLILTLIANLGDWALVYFGVTPTETPIILHYNVYFGVDSIGSWKQVYLLPAVGLVVILANFILSLYFYHKKERIAAYVLLITALMIQMGLIVASFSAIMINY